jgi:hypothetical protein
MRISATLSTLILLATLGVAHAQESDECDGDLTCLGLNKVAERQQDLQLPVVVLSNADARACTMLDMSGTPCRTESSANPESISAMKSAFGTLSLDTIGAQP